MTHTSRSFLSSLAPRAALGFFVGLLAMASSGCAAAVNRDPNLRWWAFKTYGADRICPEILKTSVPLKLQGDRGPTTGRYFPNTCTYSVDEMSRTVIVNVGGSGYAYLPTAKRVGFTLTASVEYAFDFYMHDDGNWVWGKMKRMAAGPDFRMTNAENKVVSLASIITPAGPAANLVGGQIVAGFLARGFTVVETDEGKEFSLGILPPGKRPFRPIEVDESDEAYTFSNENADIYSNQMDFLGPLEIADDGQQLQIRGLLTAPSAVDFIVVTKIQGDIWRESVQRGLLSQPPGQPVMTSVVQPGPYTRKFNLRPGLYYIVVDNSSWAGSANPPLSFPNPLFDPLARLTYVAQLVED